MAIRHEHGAARPQPPRSKDLPSTLTVAERDGTRGPDGRFLPKNSAATGRGLKALIKRHLGHEPTSAETAALYREVRTLFAGLLRPLPSHEPVVQDMVGRQARASVLSARFAARATELGLDTDEGRKALEMSLKLDQRAERLAISALDVAERLRGRGRGAAEANAAADAAARALFTRKAP